MVAHEKSIWFGCVLAASLFVLVLAGCGDVSESGSSQMAQPSKKSPPTKTAESHAAAGEPANCKPTTTHDMLGPFYEPDARASGRSSRRGQRWVRLTCRVGCYSMMAGQKGGKVGRWVCSSRT